MFHRDDDAASSGQGRKRAGTRPRASGESQEEGDEGAGSADFARILEQFESTRESGTPEVGKKVRGKIAQIGPETSFVDFGGRSEGAIETLHLRDAEGNLKFAVGDPIELFVIENKDQVILAPSVRAEPAVALSQVQEARRAGMPISGQVVGINAGGLEVDLAGLRAFCPVSQIDLGFCPDPSVYLSHSLEFLITEVAEGGKRVVLSRKALLRRQEEERARELIASLKEGAEVEGAVARLERFGAFVDLGGVDGLVHVSEIRYERVENPADVLSVGQKVRVKILSVSEKEGGRPKISLSIKAAEPDPWLEAQEMYWPGRRVRGTVVRLAEFGAFVNLSPGIDGLVHISEIDLKPVTRVRDAVQVGEVVEAIVLAVDPEQRRISLSIRDARAAGGAGPPAAEGDPAAPSAAAAALRAPAVGDLAEGWVAGIQPYGLFVDLPAYGHRARGLVPFEETGEKPGTELGRRFRVGDQVRVEIVDVNEEGKIRLSMVRAQQRAETETFKQFQATLGGGKGPGTAMAEALRRAMEERGKKGKP